MPTDKPSLHLTLEKLEFRAPNQVTDDTSVLTLKNLVLEPLLRWTPSSTPTPALFSHWTHTPDGQEWRFTIRAGAQFHDGKVCEASDIISFIDAILTSRDTFGMRWSYHRYLKNASITAADTETVVVRNLNPCAWILDVFTEFYICRVDENNLPIVGTGRYKVQHYAPHKITELQSISNHEKYHRITMTADPNAATRLHQLRSGETDAALNLERYEELQHFDEELQWIKATNTLSVMYYLNCTSGLFTSPKARLAINHAVDTTRLAQEVFSNLAEPSSTIASPFHLGVQEAQHQPIPYDPVKARRLLEQCDAAHLEKPLRLRTPTYMPERAEAISRFVVKALEDVGLKVVVDVEHDRPAYARQVGLEKNIGDMALFDSSPNSTFRILDDKISSVAKAVWWQGYQNDNVQSLMEEANRLVEGGERAGKYAQVVEELQRDPPWLYIVHPVILGAVRKGVEGVNVDHRGALVIG
ncbi:unnamed protein product [Periconia digitata]|uniref:Solute-binding protein family 5 domain-containing protein n=1 Tax=Periconia digitata TaxID=1303443 RepID=A0A9W4U9J1_9PLEO|nr:unnamed protein product [Periconia digitata]